MTLIFTAANYAELDKNTFNFKEERPDKGSVVWVFMSQIKILINIKRKPQEQGNN